MNGGAFVARSIFPKVVQANYGGRPVKLYKMIDGLEEHNGNIFEHSWAGVVMSFGLLCGAAVPIYYVHKWYKQKYWNTLPEELKTYEWEELEYARTWRMPVPEWGDRVVTLNPISKNLPGWARSIDDVEGAPEE